MMWNDGGGDSFRMRWHRWMPVLILGMLGLLIAGMNGASAARQTASAEAERPVLLLGNQSLPPMIYLKHGVPTGIVIDLAKAIARRMHRPVEIQLMDWSLAQQSVLEGRADALLQINANPERLKIYDFSEPLLISEFSIFTTAERMGVSNKRDLKGQRVGVEEKGLPILLMKEDPEIIVEVIPDFVRGFALLTSGDIDAVVADRWVGSYVIAENSIRGIKLIEEPISASHSAIAVRKGNADLLADIDSALADIRQDGTYDRIIERWRSKEVVFQTREQVRRYWWLLAGIAAVLLATMSGIILLIREIRRRRVSEAKLRIQQLDTEARNAEAQRMLYELEVSRTEIEMQNEELRNAQADLEIARARYFDLYDLAPVGYCTLGDKGLILESNLMASTLLRTTRSALINQPISRFIFNEDQAIYYRFCKILFDTRSPQEFDLRMVKNEGQPFWVRMNMTVTQDEAADVFCRVVLSDITDSKTAEHDRIARRAAEEANRAKSRFLASMSHEIRTPMNAVLGFAHLLERDDCLTSRQAEFVRIIIRSGEHLLRLISDILDMSRIEAGRTVLNPEDFSLSVLVKEMENLFRNVAASKGLGLVLDGAVNSLSDVYADQGKLRQILVNLLGNAVKFTLAGSVILRVHCRPAAEHEDAGTLRLAVEVEDTGPGIDEAALDRLFDPFYQTDEGAHAGGTGLGLSICRNYALLMGGDITVRSRVGTGTCFRLEVPLLQAKGEIRSRESSLLAIGPDIGAAGHPPGIDAPVAAPSLLTPAALEAIRNAADGGDVVLLTELIDSAESEDPPTARNLRAMADNFDYRGIAEWLDRALNE